MRMCGAILPRTRLRADVGRTKRKSPPSGGLLTFRTLRLPPTLSAWCNRCLLPTRAICAVQEATRPVCLECDAACGTIIQGNCDEYHQPMLSARCQWPASPTRAICTVQCEQYHRTSAHCLAGKPNDKQKRQSSNETEGIKTERLERKSCGFGTNNYYNLIQQRTNITC